MSMTDAVRRHDGRHPGLTRGVACSAVVGDASPVPVRPTSWARLKALARTSPPARTPGASSAPPGTAETWAETPGFAHLSGGMPCS